MGHKIHPYGFRLGITKQHLADWIALRKKGYRDWVIQDALIREKLEQAFKFAGVSYIFIKKNPDSIIISVEVARPGIAIGPKGENIKKIKKELQKVVGKDKRLNIKIKGAKNLNANAALVAQNIARGIEKRRSVKALVKRALEMIRKSGVQGAKIAVSGRIGGIEQAMTYKRQFGRVPLQTLRADIDYAYERAQTTTAGILSVKVWIYKGEIMK